MSKKIAICTGDVNGIGAEITIKALNKLNLPKENVVLISNSEVLKGFSKYEVVEIPLWPLQSTIWLARLELELELFPDVSTTIRAFPLKLGPGF